MIFGYVYGALIVGLVSIPGLVLAWLLDREGY